MVAARASVFALWAFMSGCAPSTPEGSLASIEASRTSDLWHEYRTSSSPITLSLIETELMARGESRNAGSFIGQRSVAAYGRPLYQRTAAATPTDKDCADFASSIAAQRFFLLLGGPLSDPHGLDGDGDGLACEWGRDLNRAATTARRVRIPQASPRRYGGSRCYVGPRGGTYTITSGGNRNYSGC